MTSWSETEWLIFTILWWSTPFAFPLGMLLEIWSVHRREKAFKKWKREWRLASPERKNEMFLALEREHIEWEER